MTRFWLTLERLPGQAAVASLWRRQLGEDYLISARYVVPDGEFATSYPRPDHRPGSLSVVECGPDDFVAISEEDGTKVYLKREDLLVYKLDVGKLIRTVAVPLEFKPDGSAFFDVPSTYNAGDFRPIAGFNFPVVMTLQTEPSTYRQALARIVCRLSRPFILLTPTNHFQRLGSEILLESNQGVLVPLADSLEIDGDGEWKRSSLADEWFDNFVKRYVTPVRGFSVALFPTHSEAGWSDLALKFVDGHTLSVSLLGVTKRLTYAEMGMMNGRSKKPTKQWDLLRAFADGYGLLKINKRSVERLNQKRREILARNLSEFFRIPDAPIKVTEDRKAWRTVFSIVPD